MPHFKHHLFICTNQREAGKPCCQNFNTEAARQYLKERAKELGIHGAGKCRINNAGCLDRCDQGPVMVIYPDETWYTWVDNDDLDEILEMHLINNQVVERLLISDIDVN